MSFERSGEMRQGTRKSRPRAMGALLADEILDLLRRDGLLFYGWLRGVDLNHRPLGYEPNELPDCSTPRLNDNNRSLGASNVRASVHSVHSATPLRLHTVNSSSSGVRRLRRFCWDRWLLCRLVLPESFHPYRSGSSRDGQPCIRPRRHHICVSFHRPSRSTADR